MIWAVIAAVAIEAIDWLDLDGAITKSLFGRIPVVFSEGPVFAYAGEWVTREDGTRICHITKDLHRNSVAHAEGWCEDWTVEPPKPNTEMPHDPVGQRWIASIGGHLKLHIGDEWRP